MNVQSIRPWSFVFLFSSVLMLMGGCEVLLGIDDVVPVDPADNCGNGVIDDAEECDGAGESAACNLDCTLARCGDGKVNGEGGEECDTGGASAACDADCTVARCGDGTANPEAGEECDAGSAGSGLCDRDCTRAVCGDGEVNEAAGEMCEPGPSAPECESDCTSIECGDGKRNEEAGEQCDDGNREHGDFCSNACVAATCSDGVHNGDELDQDCGGHCGAGTCRSGQTCERDSDCVAGDCQGGMCRIEPMVAAGGAHTCALLESGAVRCWGANQDGQLGHGHTQNIGDDEAAAAAGDVDVGGIAVQVVAGGAHTCALLEGGKVRCWGANEDGQLGYGDTRNVGKQEVPGAVSEVEVGGLVAQLAAGDLHTCALLESGAVRCWGSNLNPAPARCGNERLGGQLGYPGRSRVGAAESPAFVGDVDVGGRVQQLAAGASHTCALLEDGGVRCWGANETCDAAGWLGQGDREFVGDDEAPAAVGEVALAGEARQIVAGRHHTCALMETGEVRCWGARYDGQLGLGDGREGNVGDDETPAEVAVVDVGGAVVQLAAGARHSCALLEGGQVRCWGLNEHGQLGYGHMDRVGDDEAPASSDGVDVGGTAVQLTAGASHTCALLASGAIRCWGANEQGQLGHGHTGPIGRGQPMARAGAVEVGAPVAAVASNGTHTCARVDGQAVRCWGENEDGQLGYGDTITRGDSEVPASSGDVRVGGAVVQVATGETHTCALLDDGAVRCWGYNGYGQLGYGDNLARGDDETPLSAGDVNMGAPVVQVVAGEVHTCALLQGGLVRCWGANWYGQLGYGHTSALGDEPGETPAELPDVPVGGEVIQLAAGEGHTCALLQGGAVRCWGFNERGQLGYGHRALFGDEPGEVPELAGNVDLGEPAVQITAGEVHTCALLESGAVRCWGANQAGQLGYGHMDDIGDQAGETPASAADVSVGGAVAQLSAGGEHTCAVLAAGTVRCWGSNLAGQLGHDYALLVGDDELPASGRVVDIAGTAIQVATGSTHTCAVFENGALHCWGANWVGQLGYGHTSAIGAGLTILGAGDVPYR